MRAALIHAKKNRCVVQRSLSSDCIKYYFFQSKYAVL